MADDAPDWAAPSPSDAPDWAQGAAPTVSAPRAALEGLESGVSANFAPQVYGASKASGLPDILGGFRAPVGAARLAYEHFVAQPGAVTDAYNKAVADKRATLAAAETQHPVAYGAGEVGGALATLPLAPEANVLRAPAGAGAVADMGARVGNAALTAGGYGALYGAGEGANTGEGDLGDIAKGAVTGAFTSAPFGAASVPVAEAAGAIGRTFLAPFQGSFNPEMEAQRRVVSAFNYDNPGGLAAPQAANLMARGQALGAPLNVADVGGEGVRSLARSAADTSPAARQALQTATSDRIDTQKDRAVDMVNWITGTPVRVGDTREALQNAATQANRINYRAAYDAGDRPIWSPELERLAGSPDVVDAIRGAVQRGKTRAINDGFGGFNPGVNVTPDGQLLFNSGRTGVPTYPNLQFWDYVHRELRDSANVAQRAGANDQADALFGVHRALLNELDSQVPEFQAARAGAARFFGADDAITAGQNFIGGRADLDEAQRAFAQMSPPEQQLFRIGAGSALTDKINATGDRSNLINKQWLASNDARDRINLAFGPQGSNRMEAFLHLENMMNQTRNAVSGGSNTSRNLVQLALAGGYGGGAYGLTTGDLDPRHLSAAALTGAVINAGRGHINERVAANVGRLLASGDPNALRQAAQLVARAPRLLESVRGADSALSRAFIAGPGEANAVRALQAPGVGQLPGTANAQQSQNQVPRPPGQQKNGGVIKGQQSFAHGGKVNPSPRDRKSRVAEILSRNGVPV